MPTQKTLTQLKNGQKGTVINIAAGRGLSGRLEALGIRPGRTITKISSHFWRGPVTVKTGNSNIAIGFGMASKVLVETE